MSQNIIHIIIYIPSEEKDLYFFFLGIIFFSELLWKNEWDSITLKSLMFTGPCHFWTILNLSVCRLQLQYLICSRMSQNLNSAHCLLISHSHRNIISKILLLLPKIQDSLTVCRSVFSTLWVETVILCSSLRLYSRPSVEGKYHWVRYLSYSLSISKIYLGKRTVVRRWFVHVQIRITLRFSTTTNKLGSMYLDSSPSSTTCWQNKSGF